MMESGFDFVANNPICMAIIGVIIIAGCVVFLIDCLRKWK